MDGAMNTGLTLGTPTVPAVSVLRNQSKVTNLRNEAVLRREMVETRGHGRYSAPKTATTKGFIQRRTSSAPRP